jgi:hypothetical protein
MAAGNYAHMRASTADLERSIEVLGSLAVLMVSAAALLR